MYVYLIFELPVSSFIEPLALKVSTSSTTCLAGLSAAQDDDEEPQPARRHRQVSHIVGYEEDWEEAQGITSTINRQPQSVKAANILPHQDQDEDEQPPPSRHRQLLLQSASGTDGKDTAPAPVTGNRKRLVIEDDDDGPANKEAAEPPRSSRLSAQEGTTDDVPCDREADAELQSPATRLAEEGLDPVEEVAMLRSRSQRRSAGGSGHQAGASSIRDRMQQNQQKLHQVDHCIGSCPLSIYDVFGALLDGF